MYIFNNENIVGRRHGKAVMLVEDLEEISAEEISVEETYVEVSSSYEEISTGERSTVITLDESEEEDGTNQPAGKKRKYIVM